MGLNSFYDQVVLKGSRILWSRVEFPILHCNIASEHCVLFRKRTSEIGAADLVLHLTDAVSRCSGWRDSGVC